MTEAREKGDRPERASESQVLKSVDAQEARVAGASDIRAAQALNRNAHSGSAGGENQEHSLELVMPKKDGSIDVLAARVMPQETSKAEQLLTKASDWQDQLDTGSIIEAEVRKNPAAEPVSLLNSWAKNLPEGSEKQAYKQLVREQLVEMSPEAKEKLDALERRRRMIVANEQEDAGVHDMRERQPNLIKGFAEYPESLKDNEWKVVQSLPRDYLEKVAGAFEAGSQAGQDSIKETADEILKRTGQAYIDTAVTTVKFPLDVLVAGGKAVWALLEYDHDLVFNPARARENAALGGEQVGKALVAGFRLSAGVATYGEGVRQSGDYGRPLMDIGSGLNAWYEKLSPADQMAIAGEVSAGFGMGASAAEMNKLGKPGAFVVFLNEAADAMPKNPEAERRAIETIRGLIQEFTKGRKLVTSEGMLVEDTILEKRLFQTPNNGRELTPGKAAEAAGITKEDFDKLGTVEKAQELISRGFKLIDQKRYYVEGADKPLTEVAMAKKLGISKEDLRGMTAAQLEKYGATPIEPVNGSLPRNWQLAGKSILLDKDFVNHLVNVYPELLGKGLEKGIEFSKDGYPKFSEFARHSIQLAEFTGDRKLDEALANRLLGFRKTPKGYTWHHCSDKTTLELVATPLHEKIRHSGGHAMIKEQR